MNGPTLLFIANVDWFFISHRLAIARAARDAGYHVHVACGVTGRDGDLTAEGFIVHPIRIERGSVGFIGQIAALRDIAMVIRRTRPAIVHLVTIKPVLLGGIVARFLRVPRVVAAISGLGYVFIATGLIASLRRTAIGLLYRLALDSPRVRTIFQNIDDRALISRLAGIDDANIRMIRGSGVDLVRLKPQPPSEAAFTAVFAARLLIDKGVREFVSAARKLHADGVVASFLIAGDLDPHNPACVDKTELDQWRAEGVVNFVGHVGNIGELFARAHVVVLPSYREGMPLVLLEAAACGRAVVTTDVPGCRDAIEPGLSGLLVPVRDADALANAVASLARDLGRCAEMGRQGRLLAERDFAIEAVVARHLWIYAEPLA